mgnify:CR=1 FL=1
MTPSRIEELRRMASEWELELSADEIDIIASAHEPEEGGTR